MAKLIVIRAAPGTGKTTVANILHNMADSQTVLLPRDLFSVDIIKDAPSLYPAMKEVYKFAVKEFLKADVVVICEGAFYSEHWHQTFKKIEEEVTVEAYHFFLKADLETVVERAMTRKKSNVVNEQMVRNDYPNSKPLNWENEYILEVDKKLPAEIADEIARICGLTLNDKLEKRLWYSDSFHPSEI